MAAETVLSCAKKERFDDGAIKDTNVRLRLRGNKISSIFYEGGISTGKLGGSYSCEFSSNRNDKEAKWKQSGQNLEITPTSNLNDRLQPKVIISPIKGGYRIAFDSMTRQFCGFSAEFPQSLDILRNNKRCKVQEY